MPTNAWDSYIRRLQTNGTTNKDRLVTSMQRIITDDFTNSPNYFSVTIDGILQDVQIIDENAINKNPNKKRLLCKPDEDITVGELVVWHSENWICTNRDNSDVYVKGIIEKCNYTLKWKNSVGTTISKPCIIKGQTLYSDGVDETKYIVLGDGKINITLASNSDSNALVRDMRFIINNKFPFKISLIDDYTNDGLLIITMVESKIDDINDDLINSIAYNASGEHTYVISILNGISAELNVGTNLQLEVECTDNGSVVTSPIVTYSLVTGSTGFVSVSTSGLVTPVAIGSGSVLSTYNSSTDSINLNVIATAVTNFSYSLIGNIQPDDQIKYNQNKIYTAYKYYNTGSLFTGASFIFTVSLGTGALSSNYLLTTSSNTVSTLKCLEYPYIISLIAQDVAIPANTVSKTISLKGLI